MIRTSSWVALCVLLILAGVSLRVPGLVALPAFMLTVLAVTALWRRGVLDRVAYRRELRYRRIFPGETLPVSLVLENMKLLPVPWLRVSDPWPTAVAPTQGSGGSTQGSGGSAQEDALAPSSVPGESLLVGVFALRWFERVRRRYELLGRARGIYKIGPARVVSGDPFGMYTAEAVVGEPDLLVVYPQIRPLAEMGLPAEDPFGERPSRRRMFEDPARVMGVRDYRPSDSFRRIHWPATARAARLQVKEYEPTTARNLVVCLNVATFDQHWFGVNHELLEALVSLSASIVYAAAREQGFSVGLYANGCLAHADQPFRLQPGRSPEHLANLLAALAGVTSFVTGNYERFLLEAAPRIPAGSALVLVTAVIRPELPEVLLRLKRRGRRLVLVALTSAPPPFLPGVLTHHLPHLRPQPAA